MLILNDSMHAFCSLTVPCNFLYWSCITWVVYILQYFRNLLADIIVNIYMHCYSTIQYRTGCPNH